MRAPRGRPRKSAHALAICIGAAALPSHALAQGMYTPFLINELRGKTPSCRANPSAQIIGRVSGYFSGFPARSAAFEGCFVDQPTCDAWRTMIVGEMGGRIIYNRCETRR